MFTRLQKDGIKVNASKSCFGAHKIDYLVYHVTRDGFMTIPKKFEAIQALAVPKTRKQLRQFIGMIVKRRKNSKLELELMGPFPITQINDNGTVFLQKGIINDATNIRRINHSSTKQ